MLKESHAAVKKTKGVKLGIHITGNMRLHRRLEASNILISKAKKIIFVEKLQVTQFFSQQTSKCFIVYD